MSGQLRAAIIGAGFVGAVHARSVRSAGGAVVTVAASTPERSVEAAARLGAERLSATAEEAATADDVDVVHVCTPNHLHLPLVELALGAGKHVVCEKPLATDLGGARRMAAAVPDGVVASVPFVYRFYPTVREARGRVGAGELGPLRVLHGGYLQDWLSRETDDNWRVDPDLGGASRAFADIGVHWCDLVEFVTGHRIRRLTARLRTAFDGRAGGATPTEDLATVLFETGEGALGSVVVSQVSVGRKNKLTFSIDGADASLAFDQEAPETLWVGGRATNQTVFRASEGETHGARYDRVPVGHPQGYQDCFDAYVADVHDAIRGEAPDGLPTFADGVRAAVLTDAVLAAARSDAWVEVPA